MAIYNYKLLCETGQTFCDAYIYTFSVKLFEYDKRFAAIAGNDFVYYDYKSPISFGQAACSDEGEKCLRDNFDVVMADPPFLSDECLTKTAVTVKYVAKQDAKLLFCTGMHFGLTCNWLDSILFTHTANTFISCANFCLLFLGATMEDLIKRLLNLDCCKYMPKHNNNLANEFRCFANYDLDTYVHKTENEKDTETT